MPRRTLSLEEEAQIANLYREGQNSSQIAKTLNMAYQTVNRRVLKLKKVEEQNGNDQKRNTASTDVIRVSSARSKKRRSDDDEAPVPEGLLHTATRHVYEGELLTFVHDISQRTVSIEVDGREPLKLEANAFMLYTRDIERMKNLLSGTPIAEETQQEE